MKHYIDIETKKFNTDPTFIDTLLIHGCIVVGIVLLIVAMPFVWVAAKVLK